MKITLTQSGGWANLSLRCSVDTETLPVEDARLLEEILRGGEIFAPPPEPVGVGDALRYVLVVADNTYAAARSVCFTELAKPVGARQLLEVLRPLCRPEPRRRGHQPLP